MKKIIALVLFFGAIIVSNLSAQNYTIIVDRSKSLESMVTMGKYDIVYGEINPLNFPKDTLLGAGVDTLTVHLFKNSKLYSGSRIVKELKKMGYRPGDIIELSVFGATYPNKQVDSSIIALGSSYSDDLLTYVPVLGYENDKRIFYADPIGTPRDDSYIFIAIKIKE
jgi:hypothetical protein